LPASTRYTIDEGKSRVTFTGTKPVGQHKGYFNVRGGSVSTFGDEIKGGSFSIDINTMTITDAMPVEMANNLKGHLLSEDFFKAETYPVATFNITGVQPLGAGVKVDLAGATHTVSGNLRLLDKTKGISFPAIIKTDGSALKASANFNIDRTDFGMVYGNDKSLGDKFINPIVNIGLNLAARSE